MEAKSPCCLKIDTTSILMKFGYFFLHGMIGALIPYLTVFLTSTGLDIREASLISGLQFVSSTISTQIFAYLADMTGRKSLVFATVAFVATLLIFPMPWIATLQNVKLNVSQNNTLEAEPRLYDSNLFYVMLVTVTIGFAFFNPLSGFIDSFVMNIAKSFPNKYDYGKQRAYGVLGFGLLNLAAGMLSELELISSSSQYLGVFITFLPAMLLLIPTGVILEQRGSKYLDEDTIPDGAKENGQKILVKLFKLFFDMNNFMFLMSFLVAGINNIIINGFLFKLMVDELNASKTIMGISMLIGSLVDIAVLIFSTKMLSLLKSPINGLILGIFAAALRFLLISFSTNPWHIVATQVLNSLTFSLVWASGMAYVEKICPPEIIVSVFSLLNNIFFNVGGLIGFWGGGAVYSAYGSKNFFLNVAYFTGGWFLIMVAYFIIFLQLPTLCSTSFRSKSAKSSVNVGVTCSNGTINSTI